MRIDGYWGTDPNGLAFPALDGTADAAGGRLVRLTFLVDTGADVSAFLDSDANALGIAPVPVAARLAGVAGSATGFSIQTTLRFRRDGGATVAVQVKAALLGPNSPFTTSVLGRDVLDLFAVIVDRIGGAVILIRDSHRYAIHAS